MNGMFIHIHRYFVGLDFKHMHILPLQSYSVFQKKPKLYSELKEFRYNYLINWKHTMLGLIFNRTLVLQKKLHNIKSHCDTIWKYIECRNNGGINITTNFIV